MDNTSNASRSSTPLALFDTLGLSTPQPGSMARAYSQSFDAALYQLMHAGYDSQTPANPGGRWSSPTPSAPPSPDVFLQSSQTLFGSVQAEATPQDRPSSTPSSPFDLNSIISPLAQRSRNGSAQPFLANLPHLLLRNMDQSGGVATNGTPTDPASMFTLGRSQNPPTAINNIQTSSHPGAQATNFEGPDDTQAHHPEPTRMPYMNSEDNNLICFWFHTTSTPERVARSMAAGMTPRDEDRLDEEWKTLSNHNFFKGRRSALSLANHWTVLLMDYFNIRSLGWSAVPGADDSGQAIATRALAHVQSIPATNKVIGNTKVAAVIAWCSDLDNGWFVTAHEHLKDFKAPVPGSKDAWPPRFDSMATHGHPMLPTHTSMSGMPHPAYAPTPPPPQSLGHGHPAPGSGVTAPHPTHPSHGLHQGGTPHPQPHTQPGINTMASTWDMPRDNRTAAESAMGVVSSKEEPPRGQTLLYYIMAIKELMEMQLRLVEFRTSWILQLLQAPVTARFLADAEEALRQLHLVGPPEIDYHALLNQLEDEVRRRGMFPN
ncbi:hypothetical protein RhiJN_16236 [Ceratobasidium sp. AG-Ba]|nr:hypothetical protein RhiJN_16236 [Ceratobasidium sp. AG-Ba]